MAGKMEIDVGYELGMSAEGISLPIDGARSIYARHLHRVRCCLRRVPPARPVTLTAACVIRSITSARSSVSQQAPRVEPRFPAAGAVGDRDARPGVAA